jgi:hypothetical protein
LVVKASIFNLLKVFTLLTILSSSRKKDQIIQFKFTKRKINIEMITFLILNFFIKKDKVNIKIITTKTAVWGIMVNANQKHKLDKYKLLFLTFNIYSIK